MHTQIHISQTCKYILKSLRDFKLPIAIMLGLAIYGGIAMSIMPYLVKVIINRVTEHTTGDLFAVLMMPVVLYLTVQSLLSLGYRLYDYFVTIKMIPQWRAKLTCDAMDTLLNQSHNYFQNNLSGSIANKVNDLSSSVPELVQIVTDRFVFLSMLVSFSVITLSFVSIKFAALMTIWVLSFVFFVLYRAKCISHLAEDWSENISSITGRVVDILTNFLSVQLFSSKAPEKQALVTAFDKAIAAERKLQWAYFYIFLYYGISAVTLTLLSLYLLISGRQAGSISVGDFALVMIINISIMDQLWMLAKDFAQFSKLLGRIMQSLNVILIPSDLVDIENAKTLAITAGNIEFDHVHFNYKDHDAVFRDKTISISGGQKVGLVGYSGGGKTTFVNLILRLYEVSTGKILIDQQNIHDVTQDSLHNAISMIPQDPMLFHRSIFDNIRYANPKASDVQVYNAAKGAHAHEFITKLPQGYASLVGERGVKLSGGQRQRIAIARAILKNAPILILDEATSQLDSLTEQYIQESLWQLMQDKTTIVIAHRLSTLLQMDRILVFDKGKIIEDGTHSELLKNAGLYKSLWDAQIGGFLPSDKS